MERSEAQTILAAWRPGLRLEEAPEVQAALDQSKHDPILSAWLEGHVRFQQDAVRAIRALPVPPNLAQTILARRKVVTPPFRFRPSAWIAVAAGLVAILMGLWWVSPSDSDNDFGTFRRRMVRAAIREYRMDIETSDLNVIRAYLAQSKAPSDFELTPGLSRLQPVGAGSLSWQGGRAAMVCLQGGPDGMLYLFIVPQSDLKGPVPNEPEISQVNRLATGAWTRNGKTYVLASSTSLEAVRKFL